MRIGRIGCAMMVVAAAVLGGCGVPGEAGRLARQEAGVLAELPGDEAGVRAELSRQAEAWGKLAGLLREREVGGVSVGADFAELVEEVAALARRQKELIDAGEDDAAGDRAVLEKMKAMWEEVGKYLGQ